MNADAKRPPRVGCLGACVLCGIAAMLLTFLWSMIPLPARPPSYHVRSVAVLEGPEELWIFAEVHERVWRRHRFAEPPYVERPAAQFFIAVGPDGVRTRKAVRPGPTIHPNLNRFVWHGGELYLLDATDPHGYRWDGGRFVLLPPETARGLSAELGLDALAVPERFARLERLASSGERRVVRHDGDPVGFDAESKAIALRVTVESSADADRVWVEHDGPDEWKSLALRVEAAGPVPALE